jgi:hypothetical protein
MEDGGWRMEDGGWRMEDGGWRMEDGGWRMEGERWCVMMRWQQAAVPAAAAACSVCSYKIVRTTHYRVANSATSVPRPRAHRLHLACFCTALSHLFLNHPHASTLLRIWPANLRAADLRLQRSRSQRGRPTGSGQRAQLLRRRLAAAS